MHRIYADQIYNLMPLTAVAIQHIKTNKRLRSLLAIELDRTEYTILRWVNTPGDRNLTMADAIKVVREETGLSDQEILEQEPIKAG